MERQQQQQQPTLCREGCGFFGSAATEGYCSKCYMDHLRRKQSSHQHATGATSTVTDSISSASSTVSYSVGSTSGQDYTTSTINTSQDHDHSSSMSSSESRPKKNRCFVCRKKLGLTGFDCRCGGVYCSLHRYSDTHDCSFDYRENGRQEIAKNNPVVVAQKIRKL